MTGGDELMSLVVLTDPVDPPPELRERVVAAAGRRLAPDPDEVIGPSAGGEAGAPNDGEATTGGRLTLARSGLVVPWYLAIAAAFLLTISLASSLLIASQLRRAETGRRRSVADTSVYVLAPSAAAPTAEAVVMTADDEGVIRTSGLSALAGGYTYVCWARVGDEVRRLASFEAPASPGRLLHASFDATVAAGAASLFITIEAREPIARLPSGPMVLSSYLVSRAP